jgi:hypothetical protein
MRGGLSEKICGNAGKGRTGADYLYNGGIGGRIDLSYGKHGWICGVGCEEDFMKVVINACYGGYSDGAEQVEEKHRKWR